MARSPVRFTVFALAGVAVILLAARDVRIVRINPPSAEIKVLDVGQSEDVTGDTLYYPDSALARIGEEAWIQDVPLFTVLGPNSLPHRTPEGRVLRDLLGRELASLEEIPNTTLDFKVLRTVWRFRHGRVVRIEPEQTLTGLHFGEMIAKDSEARKRRPVQFAR